MSLSRTKMKLSPNKTSPTALTQVRRPTRAANGLPRRLSRKENPAAGRLRNAIRHE